MFSITCTFTDLPVTARVSARSVDGIDLAATGGYALLGSFAGNYDPAAHALTAVSSNPIVVMVRDDRGNPQQSSSRFAIVIIPADAAANSKILDFFPLVDAINAVSSDGFSVDLHVQGEGIVFGVYTDTNRKLTGNIEPPFVNGNVYYQVASDLESLARDGFVVFQSNKGVVYSHDPFTTINKGKILLPRQWTWGPEIAGVLTVCRRDNPTQLFFLDRILLDDPLFLDSYSAAYREELFAFLLSQVERMNNMAAVYEAITKIYKSQ